MRRFVMVLGGVLLAPSLVSAHTLMVDPEPRSGSDGLKTGPCGNVPPTATPTALEGGSTITVSWLETVDHPGYYRIAFSPPGDAAFEDNVLLDQIADVVCSAPPCAYSAEVTLPAEPCEGCALQLIQYMGTAPPYSRYCSCADVTLLAGPVPDAGPMSDAGPQPDAGEVPSGGDAGPGADDTDDLGGGCATAHHGSPGSVPGSLWPLAFALAALRRRKRRQDA